MQRHKHSTEENNHPMKKYPKAEKQDILWVCDNLQCIHYDQHDPDGTNCSLLFALSEEGCEFSNQRPA